MNEQCADSGESCPDFDFRHHLRDTILLLGGKLEIANLLRKSKDATISEKDVDDLRNYNCLLFGLAKDRLRDLNSIKIQPSGGTNEGIL